jgi:16S rRNA (uracil1498-N3)-methyltransferase
MDRAKRIIKEASEQCGRGDVPVLEEITNLESIISNSEKIVTFDITGELISNLKLEIDNYSILIGPEGGWSEKELSLFKEKNIPIYSLGGLTLRAETAAITAGALLQLL